LQSWLWLHVTTGSPPSFHVPLTYHAANELSDHNWKAFEGSLPIPIDFERMRNHMFYVPRNSPLLLFIWHTYRISPRPSHHMAYSSIFAHECPGRLLVIIYWYQTASRNMATSHGLRGRISLYGGTSANFISSSALDSFLPGSALLNKAAFTYLGIDLTRSVAAIFLALGLSKSLEYICRSTTLFIGP
jgi:hypothetical protein